MLVFNRLVFALSILITFNICYSKVYLKPDDVFSLDLENSLEFLNSNEQNNLIAILPNHHAKPVDESTEFLNKVTKYKFIESEESNEMGKPNLKTNEFIVESDSSTQDSEESDLEISDLNLDNDQKKILRKRWRSSCDKQASRTCTSACKNAYKIVCSSYRCKSRMKRDFKKECRKNCKSKFMASVSSYETSDITL